ncbi:MAG: glycosyltransferase family 4 protein [Bryobacteraceae bacterium]
MNVGIVAPSPVPFCIGGAENLWWGLQDFLNQRTGHTAEIIKLPSREFSFWDLVDTYREFSRLDLSHFDVLISGKYPAWMVWHPNHVCYMLHCLRGLYDTYHLMRLPMECDGRLPEVASLVEFMRYHHGDPTRVEEFFDRADRLRHCGAAPETFAFPGPLIRKVVHFLDAAGLAPSRIRKYAAISRNVAGRLDYFPCGAAVEVVYHPSNLRGFASGGSEYFFTVGRLDGAKRICLLVEAMRRARSTVPLKIAGTGPEEDLLRELAGDDPRIEFLGFVRDQEVTRLYANALAVVYAPYDEDYGVVTIEAMASGKPVLTTTDAGGPLEFVRHGENGYVVDPVPEALAERLDYLDDHRQEAIAMAAECRRTAQPITWENAVRVLLGPAAARPSASLVKRKPKITVTATFPICPPRGGGQSRIYHLYRNLASEFEIEIVSFGDHGQEEFDEFIAPGVREIRIPKTLAHLQAEWRLTKRLEGVAASDVMMPKIYSLTPRYAEALARSAAGSDWLVASHPYLLPALENVRHGQTLIYEAHNLEAVLKQSILPANRLGRYFLRLTESIEGRCCDLSSLVMTCSREDACALSRMYGTERGKMAVVPNGVDLDSVTFHPLDLRRKVRRQSHAPEPFTVLFMASWHGPNIEAALCVTEIARRLQHVNFLLVGGVGCYLDRFDFALPANVKSLGVVDDQTKNQILSWVDLAINPMQSGSGTNLKMLDYMAAGVPLLSTPFGARGLDLENRVQARLAPLIEFPRVIEEMRGQDDEVTATMVETARGYAATRFSWDVIGRGLMERLLSSRHPKRTVNAGVGV